MVGQEDYFRAMNGNSAWAANIRNTNPSFLPNLAAAQHPAILWIGCSDSRIPETTITGSQPGDIFVHRNIANVVNHVDLSISSVIEYSVDHLAVKHIFLVGHTGCGGCAAAIANKKIGPIDIWLQPLRELREANWTTLQSMSTTDQINTLAQLNVTAGVQKVLEHPSVVTAVSAQALQVHGIMYDLASGTLSDLGISDPSSLTIARDGAFITT